SELNRLIHRLQDEAKLDIYYTSADQANVNVHAVSRRQIQRTLPMAACFVAPNVVDLEDFKASRKTAKTSWSAQTERRMVSLFIPSDARPTGNTRLSARGICPRAGPAKRSVSFAKLCL
ncbi:MAG: hypothetical protein ACPHIS_01125, partial [Paracoccaceae bacterium]